MPPKRLLLAGLLILSGLAPDAISAQASGYVPLADPAYAELDALVGAGLVQEAILGQRPYSRVSFARMVAEARARADAGEGAASVVRVAEALDRLEARFVREAGWLCAEDGTCPEVEPLVRATEARADFTWADSPSRAMRTEITPGQFLDATVNPLLQRNDGRVLADGWTLGAEAGVELQMGRSLTAVARPRIWTAGVDGGDTETDGTAHDLYLRGVFGNLSVEVGRNHLFEGHGRAAGVMLSRNARGMDMVRVSNAAPFRLPWIFDALGPAAASAFVADMGEDRDTPGSKLIVFRGSFRPHPNFEFGGTLLNHQGGEGAPPASAWERFTDLFPIFEFHGPPISDKVIGIDLRLTLPERGIDAYVEWSNTDFNLHLNRFHEMLGDVAAWVGGVRLGRLGTGGRGTFWIEGHRSGVISHMHHRFSSGLTLDGRTLGDPLGPLGTGLSGGFDWVGNTHTIGISGTWEQYRGDDYQPNEERGGEYRLEVVSDNPDETRLRGEIEWSRQEAAVGLRPWARLGVERVTRFDFTDQNRTNAVVQVGLSYLW